MADTIGIVVTGDTQVALKFEQFPQKAHARLLARITALTDDLAARVRGRVPVKTGKLRGEIESHVIDREQKITGVVAVGDEFAKAGALEYGAHRPARVTAHDARLDHVFGHRLASPITVMVAAHSRQTNIIAQRFLRDPITEMQGQVVASLRDAVAEAANE